MVFRLPREETVEALLARLRLLRGLPSSIQGSRKERGRVCVSLQLTRWGQRWGQGLPGRRRPKRKSLLFGAWGAGEALAWDSIPTTMPREVGGPGSCRGGGSCLQPKTENRGSFILALCAPTRNLPLSVLRKLPSPAFFRLPSATCLLPSHTHHKPSLRSPGDTRNVHQAAPPSPARELTSSGVPRTGEKRVVLGLPATASLLLLRCCLLRPQSQLSTHSFCLSLSSFVVSLPLTLSLSF